MVARDGGCRWPGCERPPGWCQAHHIDEVFLDDGPTDVNMMVLTCSTHHDYLHHHRWKYTGTADNLSLRKPDGTLIPAPCHGPAFNNPTQLQLVGT
jgi:hypothetical protein